MARVTLTVGNLVTHISDLPSSTKKRLAEMCSYKVQGYQFSPAYKRKVWDGREHLFRPAKGGNGYYVPPGLTADVARLLTKRGVPYRVVNKTTIKNAPRKFAWNKGRKPRYYQRDAVAAMRSKPLPGHCVIKLPTRSGKTYTAALHIRELGLPSIFVVTSKLLLHQAIAEFRACFPHEDIGQLGDGVTDLQDITVATMQTLHGLAPKSPKPGRKGKQAHPVWDEINKKFDHAGFDELHHLAGSGDWHETALQLDVRYKTGYSATLFPDSDSEQSRGIIWTRAICGPIVYAIDTSRLIEEGYLLPQEIIMVNCAGPAGLRRFRYSRGMLERCLLENEYRNKLIAKIAKKERRSKTVIVVREIRHVEAICEKLEDVGLSFAILTGKEVKNRQLAEDIRDEFVHGDNNLIVSTVLGEGVDIPAIETVIVAEGGKDEKRSFQRMRNITPNKAGAKQPKLYDFMDSMNTVLLRHSKARLAAYNSEEAFVVREIEPEEI